MSVEGFIAGQRRRIKELQAEIAAIVMKDGGVQIKSHFRAQAAEIKVLREKIEKAGRKGINREIS